MDAAAIRQPCHEGDAASPAQEQRGAPRFVSLIRAAKLVSAAGEFVCVIRDVSSTGVRLRSFHALPLEGSQALELQNGESYPVEPVRSAGAETSFRFLREVAVDRLVRESWVYPRRPLRIALALPVSLRRGSESVAAMMRNISQQGCRLTAAAPLALEEAVTLRAPQLPGIRAKVRWRRKSDHGLVFDDTFSLRDFAVHVARLQCPGFEVF